MSATYNIGDYITIKRDDVKHQFEIISCSPKSILLIDVVSGVTSERKTSELDEFIVSGNAVIHQKNKDSRKLLSNDAIDFVSYPEHLKKKARERYIYVRGILDQTLKSLSSDRISPIIENIYKANSFETLKKKPSTRTVQYWLSRYINSGYSIRALLPLNHGNPTAKISPSIEPYIDQAIETFKAPERISISKAYDNLKTAIEFDNRLIPDKTKKMKVPALSAFIRRLEKHAKKEITFARLGKEETRKLFKLRQLPQDIKFILQRVEVDHTQADLFVVDSKTNLVLGRPYVTALLDYKSKSILGFYIGFEKPSYLSIARALQYAILPKTYIKELYPEVENDWDCYGIPKTLVVDRGKDFESVALMDACADLNIRIERNPAKHPWFKGSIESFFKSLNQKLLQELKGKVFPNIVDTNLYNPQKHAVITLELLLKLFHVWLIDIYQNDKVSKGTKIPSVSWQEDFNSVPRRIISSEKLDIVLSESKVRKNSQYGIVNDHIWYDSPELLKLRAELGFKNVQIKINREDLGYIRVLDERKPTEKKYFKVPAVDQKYASGLSLHQHQVIKKFNKTKLDNEYDIESLALAKTKVTDLISDYLMSSWHKKTSSVQTMCRYLNLGQQVDQSVNSSAYEEVSKELNRNSSVNEIIEFQDLEVSGFDGTNNNLPDELEF